MRNFAQFLQALKDGKVHGDLTDDIQDIVAKLNDARAEGIDSPAGKLVLTFDFKLVGQTVEVLTGSKVTTPKEKRERTIFWTTPQNELSRSNPRQQRLPFSDVASRDGAETRTIS